MAGAGRDLKDYFSFPPQRLFSPGAFLLHFFGKSQEPGAPQPSPECVQGDRLKSLSRDSFSASFSLHKFSLLP